MEQRPPGYGIVAHRGIKAICQMAGIKDIHVKVCMDGVDLDPDSAGSVSFRRIQIRVNH